MNRCILKHLSGKTKIAKEHVYSLICLDSIASELMDLSVWATVLLSWSLG